MSNPCSLRSGLHPASALCRRTLLTAFLLGLCLSPPDARVSAAEPNLLPNPGFEEAAGWEGLLRDGAEGEWKLVAGAARSEVIAKDVKEIALPVVAQQTYWLLFE